MKTNSYKILVLMIALSLQPLHSADDGERPARSPMERAASDKASALISRLAPDDARGALDPSLGGIPRGEAALGKVRAGERAEIKEILNRPSDKAPYAVRFAGEGEVEVEVPKDRLAGREDVTFFRFRYRPALGDSVSCVDLGGAAIGYRPMARNEGLAEVVALKGELGEDAEEADWIPTGISCPIRKAKTCQTSK